MEMARGGNGGTGGGESGAGRIDRESGEGKVKRLEGEEGREEDVSGSKTGEEVRLGNGESNSEVGKLPGMSDGDER
jgi:hypothetical protein